MWRSRAAVSAIFLTLTCSCTQYLIVAPEPRYAGQQHSRTVVSLGGGNASKPNPGAVAKECGSDELAMVRVTRNFGQSLLSLVTLGLYAPATIHYYCSTPPPPPVGTIDTPGR
jgi:hypothetical protein